MTDNERKILTEWMGKLYHELEGKYKCSCGQLFHFQERTQAEFHCKKYNRTFTTPQDMYDVFKLLVDRDKMHDFFKWSWVKWAKAKIKDHNALKNRVSGFNCWLFYSPARLCELVLQAIKEGII